MTVLKQLLLAVCLLGNTATAMHVDTAWVRSFGDTAPDILMDLAVDAAGATYVTGYVWGSGGSFDDIATIKYLPSGDTAWARIYNGPANGFDRGNGVAVDQWGNVYVCGMSDTTNNIADWVVLKYLADGQLAWRSRIGGYNLREEALNIAVDDSGYIYVTGMKLTVAAGYDFLTVKYSQAGGIIWQDQYDGEAHGSEYPHDLVIGKSGEIVVCGQEASASGPVFTAIKYANTGLRDWVRSYDSPEPIDICLRTGVDSAGNVYVCGYNQPSSGIQVGITTIKYSPDGDTLWTSVYDDPFGAEDFVTDMVVDPVGHAYVVGNTNGGFLGQQFTVIKYQPDGDTAWVRAFPGAQTQGSDARAVSVDAAGNVYATGYINTPTPNNLDLLVVSLRDDGVTRWQKEISSPGAEGDVGSVIAVDAVGNILVGGTFDGGVSTYEDYLVAKFVQYECGDADGSGMVTISDAVYLINYIFAGGPAPNPLLSGDVDCTGAVSISDAVYLINYIFAGGPAPCAACP